MYRRKQSVPRPFPQKMNCWCLRISIRSVHIKNIYCISVSSLDVKQTYSPINTRNCVPCGGYSTVNSVQRLIKKFYSYVNWTEAIKVQNIVPNNNIVMTKFILKTIFFNNIKIINIRSSVKLRSRTLDKFINCVS